jgi:hypothetical protein
MACLRVRSCHNCSWRMSPLTSLCVSDITLKTMARGSNKLNFTVSLGEWLLLCHQKTHCFCFIHKQNVHSLLTQYLRSEEHPFTINFIFQLSGPNFLQQALLGAPPLAFHHKSKLALNIVRVLSGISGHRDRMMMLQLDHHLICPKIANGSFLYDPASEGKLSGIILQLVPSIAAALCKHLLQGSFLHCRYTVKLAAHLHRLSCSGVFWPTLLLQA